MMMTKRKKHKRDEEEEEVKCNDGRTEEKNITYNPRKWQKSSEMDVSELFD